MYKALITDLDGTAVKIGSDGSEIDETTRVAILRAQKRGFKVACATGREWEIAESAIVSLGLKAPSIIEGGTRIVDTKTGETLWEKHLEAGAPRTILQILQQETDTGMLMDSADVSHRALPTVQELPDQIRFVYLLGVEEEVAIRISNTINSLHLAIAHITPSWEGNGLDDIHVTHAEATKEHAIQVWQALEHITPEETIGLGDSGNDLPIFQAAGLKVAVGNATPALKELADYIAPTVEQGALAHVIEKFLL